ncbi:MAG: hypothetical protein IJT36_01165 [Alphaproteobacteria bacterium]|nr:hypothetical protein [Alphaproteobacteria bacterium]
MKNNTKKYIKLALITVLVCFDTCMCSSKDAMKYDGDRQIEESVPLMNTSDIRQDRDQDHTTGFDGRTDNSAALSALEEISGMTIEIADTAIQEEIDRNLPTTNNKKSKCQRCCNHPLTTATALIFTIVGGIAYMFYGCYTHPNG